MVFGFTMGFAQKEFHVFPVDHKTTPGKATGNGSLSKPWDLQTALSQNNSVVNGGAIIWLHKGVYNGRYISTISSSNNKKITVSPYGKDEVVLNGNLPSKLGVVLEVKGGNVIFKNFTITFLGNFSRLQTEVNFQKVDGISHVDGENCEFINLTIHNVPGSGIGSWKRTGGTKIEGCTIYNNGYMSKARGSGVGIYVQNESEQTRFISNNIIFNNYYKGIEVWSATSGTGKQFVKNVLLENNVLFNNGAPVGKHWSNVIIASDDKEGINVAKNITFRNNILYHNADFYNKSNFGDGNSLTIGYNAKALVEDVVVENNIIIGHNNALNLLYAKSLTFKNNTVYTGYVHFNAPVLQNYGNYKFSNNSYFSRKQQTFRILKHQDYQLKDWTNKFNLDAGSSWKQVKDFTLHNVLDISKIEGAENSYKAVLFEKDGKPVAVNFSDLDIEAGTTYKVFDVENPEVVLKEGKLNAERIIEIPMQNTAFVKPLHNNQAVKTVSNFGVYKIDFSTPEKKQKASFFGRLFGWLF